MTTHLHNHEGSDCDTLLVLRDTGEIIDPKTIQWSVWLTRERVEHSLRRNHFEEN